MTLSIKHMKELEDCKADLINALNTEIFTDYVFIGIVEKENDGDPARTVTLTFSTDTVRLLGLQSVLQHKLLNIAIRGSQQ